jgi:ComF family protein
MHPVCGETCRFCGERLPGFQPIPQSQACAACQQERPYYVKATAYGSFEGGLRDLIHLLKYEQVLPAAGLLGIMLAEAIHKLETDSGPTVVIPVPLHRSKRRQRGFNQAELIVRAAMKKLGTSNLELATDVLERCRATESQIGLTRPQRSRNLRGAFRVVHLSRVLGCDVLLVDDVLTTGTTASECARVLRKAGAGKVWVATVARTLKNSDQSFGMEPQFETADQAS